MLRGHIPLSHVALRVLTIAITLVVGLKVGTHLSASGTTAFGIGNADHKVLEDDFKGRERVEPRLSAAHFLDRGLPAHASNRSSIVSATRDALGLAAAESADRSQGERLPIVKHVPRMERGDPPRT
jgi:hypothetical protein